MRKKLLLTFFAIILALASWANGTEIDGIYYLLDSGTRTATVTYTGKDTSGSTNPTITAYSGSVTIPSTITTNGITYSVTSIGEYAFYCCFDMSSINIPNSVTSIGEFAFYGCTGLTSITIPNSVTSIGPLAFSYCTILMSVNIPNTITSIELGTFQHCTGLTSVDIPYSVTSIGEHAFSGCTGLTSVNIPNSVTSIGVYAFGDCTGLSSINIPNSVTIIGSMAFNGCTGLSSINIPNSVTSIGDMAFYGCTGLTSITIPNSVTSIRAYAFSGCSGLTDVYALRINPIAYCCVAEVFDSTPIKYSTLHVPAGCVDAYKACEPWSCFGTITDGTTTKKPPVLTNTVGDIWTDGVLYFRIIGEKESQTVIVSGCVDSSTLIAAEIPVTVKIEDTVYDVIDIGSRAFYGCTGLTSITIPNSITSIRSSAFDGCTGLKKVTLNSKNIVSSEDYNSSSNLKNLFGNQVEEYVLGNLVTSIGEYAFYGCTSLTSVAIGNSVTSIGSSAFYGCKGLTSVSIPNSVTSIKSHAFDGCSEDLKIYARKGSSSVLALWNANYLSVYDTSSKEIIKRPTLTFVNSTQSTATLKLDDFEDIFDSYNFEVSEEYYRIIYSVVVSNPCSITLTELAPQKSYSKSLFATSKDKEAWYPIYTIGFQTANISPTATATNVAPSSVTLKPFYIHGDADVTGQKITINGMTQDVEEGKNCTLTGLNPNKKYNYTYTITANGYDYTYTGSATTTALTMTTQQPKVINAGNVIVAAETNLDEAETNVGFEWRRTDWTDDFASNTGGAYLYGGTMEGYIRNLYTEKLWKYRPYYESSDGTRYYGDWVGIDPTNTSYFEPTVHTYATINVQGNSASVKGYAMRGTDNVSQQGFKYWKASSNTRIFEGAKLMAADIPADAQTVIASGQVMTATLTGLDYETNYICVAFVTTSEGETFYGEQQNFRTGENTTGIGSIVLDGTANAERTVVGYYNMQGQRLSEPQRGVNIIRYSDGTSKKVIMN